MSLSRRRIIRSALGTALAAALPGSVVALALGSSSDRFLHVALKDGRILAIDRVDGRKAFLLTRKTPNDGAFPLSKSGSVDVRGGALRGVVGNAASPGYRLVQQGGVVVVSGEDGRRLLSIPVPVPR